MNSTIKTLKEDIAINYAHAPSLTAALRYDAEEIAQRLSDSNSDSVAGALCTKVLGSVEIDAFRIDSGYFVEFFSDDEVKPFARVLVS